MEDDVEPLLGRQSDVEPLLSGPRSVNDVRVVRELADMTRSQLVTVKAGETLMSVAWVGLNYYVPAKKDRLHILKGLEGCVLPGTMLAIIGGSGAGKSTLLDILARRKTMGEITGEVLYNGVPSSQLRNLLLRVSGYVTQEDVLKETLTVRETLMFQAELRLDPRLFSEKDRIARVDKVLADLGLTHRADSRIGNEAKRGLSGGEKKRVAIGVQLVTDPSVLYLDEPTSGLDAYNSLSVVRLLRQLAEKGKTVVATVHQPRSTMYDLFDRLLVLDQGRAVYQGPAQEAAAYFSRLGFRVPNHVSPADYVIDVLLDPARASFAVADVSNLNFADEWDKSKEADKVSLLFSLPF